ncbi:hypothetical protein HDU98_006008 [Podochytrium sp. JEL0797]|nr:hypothetical protein HDU98_006008 [Podochytrium sp. JEL0797]
MNRRIACLIIGDEVLNGKTIDTNSRFLAKLCFATGFTLERIETIPYHEPTIISTIRRLSSDYPTGHVFTSGGIGPTHDDITYQSLAAAFSLPLQYHPETTTLMREFSSSSPFVRHPTTPFEMNPGRIRMATLPSSPTTRVAFPCRSDKIWVPVVTVNENVHVFPGIPRLFERLSTRFLEDVLVPSTPGLLPFVRKQIATDKMESEIADALTRWQAVCDAEGKGVRIGSYPRFGATVGGEGRAVRVVVSVIGVDQGEVEKVGEGVKREIDGFEELV